MSDLQARYWTAILYPENLKEDWIAYADEWHVCTWISPMHSCDSASVNNAEYKDHYHVVVAFDGGKTVKAFIDLLKQLSLDPEFPCFASPQKVNSPKRMIQYLVHLNADNKPKYDPNSITCLNGADLSCYFDDNAWVSISDIFYLVDNGFIRSFKGLLSYAVEDRPDWLPVISKHSFIINKYFEKDYYEEV